jgi:hypothetical protein
MRIAFVRTILPAHDGSTDGGKNVVLKHLGLLALFAAYQRVLFDEFCTDGPGCRGDRLPSVRAGHVHQTHRRINQSNC